MTVEAVLFDLDDTLLDAQRAVAAGIDSLVAARMPGGDVDEAAAVWTAVFDAPFERVLRGEISLDQSRVDRVTAWAERLAVTVEPGRHLEVFADFLEGYEAGWACFADVGPALAALPTRVLGVVTNGDPSQQRQKLDALRLTDRMSAVVVSGDLGIAKPSREIFEHAARRIGVPVDRCVMVGDSLDRDAAGARAAGMVGVWLNREDSTEDPAGPTIHSLDELPALLERL